MKNFSDISNDFSLTERDKFLNEFVSQSGLEKEKVTELYESFALGGLAFIEIAKLMNGMFSRKNVLTAIDFFKTFSKKAKELSDGINPGDYERNTKDLITALNDCILNKNIDAVNLLKIVINVLLLKDADKLSKIIAETGYGTSSNKTTSQSSYSSKLNNYNLDRRYENRPSYDSHRTIKHTNNHYRSSQQDSTNIVPINNTNRDIVNKALSTLNESTNNLFNLEDESIYIELSESVNNMETLPLYESLRDIMVTNYQTMRGNVGWNVYDNYHDKIVTYLNYEIEQIQYKNNINIVTDNFREEFFEQIITSSLNPMYKTVNNLKQIIPDLQVFLFDLTVLVSKYVLDNKLVTDCIDRRHTLEFHKATTELLSKIVSSKNSSIFLKCCDSNNDNFIRNIEYIEMPSYIYEKYPQDYCIFNKIDIRNIADCIQIIQALSMEFNMQIRPSVRNFVTKSFNLIGKFEKYLYQVNNINQYK